MRTFTASTIAIISFLAVAFTSQPAHAQRTASALRADLSAILPAGKVARLAYVRTTTKTDNTLPAFPFQIKNSTLCVVSSDDGIVKPIYPTGSSTGSLYNVNLSYNGQKIVLFNNNTSEVIVLDWSGTLIKKFSTSGGLIDYWYDASSGKEYILTTGGTLVNIADPNDKKALNISAVSAGNGGGISDDGKMVLVYQNSKFGLIDVSSRQFLSTKDDGGCQTSMRPGLPYQYSHNHNVHDGIHVYNSDGSQDVYYQTSQALMTWINADAANRRLDGCGSAEVTSPSSTSKDHFPSDCARFTRERDYATFFVSSSKCNPILWRCSDQKFTYIEQNSTCTFAGDMDMVFLSGGTDVAIPARSARIGSAQPSDLFTVSGRRIATDVSRSKGASRVEGIVIGKTSLGVAARVRM